MRTKILTMRRTLIGGAISASVSLFFLLPNLASAASADSFEVSGWVPYWKTASGTASIIPNIDTFTEVNPFIYTVKQDGTLYQASPITDQEWVDLKARAKQANVRFVPTITWAGADAILPDPVKRQAHISSIVQQVYQYGFDGIDIDYEQKSAETKDSFSLFLKELQEAMGVDKWIMCTIEARTPLEARYSSADKIPADIAYSNDYAAINTYCDRVRIMAYDQGRIDLQLNAVNQAPYIPIADPTWVEKVVRLAMKDINPNKITIGVPTYGYEYDMFPMDGYSSTTPAATATSTKMTYSRLWSFNPNYAVGVAQKLGLSVTRSGSGEAMLTFPASQSPEAGIPLPNATRVLIWSDAQAIQQKVDLAQRLGIRGVSIFSINGGEDSGIWNVLAGRKKPGNGDGAQKKINLASVTETTPSDTATTDTSPVATKPSMPTKDLKSGMRSEDVKTLQKFLNNNGFPVATTGLGSKGNETFFFGAGTRSALMRFQKAHKISPASGYYGPKTRAVIAGL